MNVLNLIQNAVMIPLHKKRKVVEDYDSDEMDTEINKKDDLVEVVDPSFFQPMTAM